METQHIYLHWFVQQRFSHVSCFSFATLSSLVFVVVLFFFMLLWILKFYYQLLVKSFQVFLKNLPMCLIKLFLWWSVQFSCSVVSDSLRPHELQHAGPPCPSPPSPGTESRSPTLQADSLFSEPPGKPREYNHSKYNILRVEKHDSHTTIKWRCQLNWLMNEGTSKILKLVQTAFRKLCIHRWFNKLLG